MKQRCILLYAMPYSIEENGSTNQGISLFYLPVGDLSPMSDKSRGSRGVAPCKQSVDISFNAQLPTLPGIYDVDFVMRTVQNKPTLVPENFVFISDVVISPVKQEVK